MLSHDFTETFNAAIQVKDWPLVVVLGESVVAQNEANTNILFNLGLAYLKNRNPAMATAVLLSVPEVNRDADFNLAIDEAFRLSGHSRDELEIGTHGFDAVGIQLAQNLRPLDLTAWCVGAFGLTIILGIVLVGMRKSKHLLKVLQILMIANVAVVMLLMTGLWMTEWYQSHWGAVVEEAGAELKSSPTDQGESLKILTKGKPVIVVGDSSQEWVKVYESSGSTGWVKGLQLRVLH